MKKLKPKRFVPPSPAPSRLVEGILEIKGRVGFVLSENSDQTDVLIQGTSLRLAMNGDRVRARITSTGADKRRAGEIVEIVNRAHQTVVGTFKRLGNMPVAVSEYDQSVIRVLNSKNYDPKVGDLVVVHITKWPTRDQGADGNIIEILGSRGEPGVDLQMVIRKAELPQKFSAAAEKEASTFGAEVPESVWKDPSRELFFDDRVFTIDGADAKDFDDAVSIERLASGWKLGVHIADVAHYVKQGSPIDEEAYKRGTSVYFPGTVLPMLPFNLSDGLCSLRPYTIRLTLSCIMQIDQNGRVGDYRIVESAIRSAKRFTYEEVENILNGQDPSDLDPKIISDVREMGNLARLIRKKRFEHGSLDFDFPEPDVEIDVRGRPTDIQKRERLESHRLIEDFMVLANETVARHMKAHPFIYRIHETPDPARAEKLRKTLEGVGLQLPQDLSKPKSLSGVLIKTEGTRLQPMVHLMILRSLKQAIYSPVNKGHFGLASECYTHFTSPIRRYPDLIVHRLLKERIHHVRRAEVWKKQLQALCEHCSKRERVAVVAEREFMEIQKTRLMEPHVGETFSGVISSVTNFGIFVQLDKFFVEGLVHVTSLGSDYFFFDETKLSLTGRRTHVTYVLGQKVNIKLVSANILKHQLDFQLVSDKWKEKRRR